jgi:ubiquinone/menaquinone biosynthesis C-methylase UbiE
MTGYALDNSWGKAKRRLALLEATLDPKTKRRALALGLATGWRCLEVGAGGGSVALWLSEQVGEEGKVVATDINPTLLKKLERPNLESRRHDILNEPLPAGEFDLVHSRWILHHLPTPEIAIGHMISALWPGGWLLLEEVDFFPVHASHNQDYRDFMTALVNAVVKASGRDCFWARSLPEIVAKYGLSNLGGEGDFPLLRGGSEVAEFFVLTAEQMRDRMLEGQTIDADTMDRALSLLSNANFWAFGGGGVSVWGQSPRAGP